MSQLPGSRLIEALGGGDRVPLPGDPDFMGPLPPTLSLREEGLFYRMFPQLAITDYSVDQARQMMMDYYAQYQGIQDLPPSQLRANEIADYGDNAGMPVDMEESAMKELHAQTYIPLPFRMRHVRAGSGLHLAMLGNRIVLTFTVKKSCNGFCRMWNSMFAHIGCANEFLPQDVIQVFADMLVMGSGDNGVQNGFSPVFKGRLTV